LNGRIADVVGYHEDGTIEVVEIENDRSIDRPHGRAQIADLAVWASRSKRRRFEVAIVQAVGAARGSVGESLRVALPWS
jgi:hypothetical protein